MWIRIASAGIALVLLCACGDGGGGEQALLVSSSDTELAANPGLIAAVAQTPFTFASGVPSFGTGTTTTVMFTSAASSPAFSIAADGNTATGTTSFGSCIFAIQASTFPAGHVLSAGRTITITPCDLEVNTKGMVANGVPVNRSVALLLGAAASAGASVTVSVDVHGQLTLNGSSAGTVTLAPLTGAS